MKMIQSGQSCPHWIWLESVQIVLMFNLNAGLSNLMVAICFAWRLLAIHDLVSKTVFSSLMDKRAHKKYTAITNFIQISMTHNHDEPQIRMTTNFMYLWRTKSPPSKTRAASPKIVLRIATTDRLGMVLMRYSKDFLFSYGMIFYNCASRFSVPNWNKACMTSNCTWNPLGPQV